MRSVHITVLILIFLIAVRSVSWAGDSDNSDIELSANRIEYRSQEHKYIATGNVILRFQDTVIRADEMNYDSDTSYAVIKGNVLYEDSDAVVAADKIELNINTKLGTIYNSSVFYRKTNVHLQGGNITKTGEKSFYLDKATFTTCDASPPAWHISAQDINATQHQSITARHSTFNIRTVPVLYTPYFWAPLKTDRQTGFLFPSFGYSSKRGNYYRQGFFWAIKGNQDTSLYVDYYSEKGFGEGLDYRYIANRDTRGEIWLYNIRDDDPPRNLTELKSYNNFRLPFNISGYLKAHFVNVFDYYEEMDSTSAGKIGFEKQDVDPFGFSSEERLQKYLDSNLHITKPLSGGRAYLLAQGRKSLEGSSKATPQIIPEAALVFHTRSGSKYMSYNLSLKGTNFWRDEGQKGERVDINPSFFLSYGRILNLTQKIGAHETLYFLNNPSTNLSRFTANLSTSLSTRFYKKFSTFVHLVEPVLEYTYIPPVHNDNIPFFDSLETITRKSSISYALTNRLSGTGGRNLEARLRFSQSYSLLDDADKEFSPFFIEATLNSAHVGLSLNVSYDVYDGKATEAISSLNLKNNKGYITLGKNFRRATNLDQYTVESGIFSPIRILKKNIPVSVNGTVWYDAKGGGVQEMQVTSTYHHQCWSTSVTYKRQANSYQIVFMIQLKGLGRISVGNM